MNIHHNASTCPHSRALLVKRVLDEGLTPKAAAAALGVSVRSVYKWLARFRAQGPAGLLDRPSRARHIPHRLGAPWVDLIARLRREHRMTGAQIARRLRLPRSTVAARLKRLGMNRLKLLEPPAPARRYERKRPGELVHLDVKKLARIQRPGHRVTGDRRDSTSGAGWEFVHIAIVDHSRLAFVVVLHDEKTHSACAFLRRAAAWFRTQGIVVERVMTDNGSCYRARAFAQLCRSLRVRHIRTRPYTPKTNGKAERFIQTLLREWAYALPYSHSRRRTAQLPPWLHRYNHRRPHGSLGGRAPITRLEALA